MKTYEYTYTEHSVDVREWLIKSPKKLTEEQVYEIGADWGSFNEGETTTIKDKYLPECEVTFKGTEYGDDTQVEIQGELEDE